MNDSVAGELLLACPECNRAVAVHYHKGFVYQGLTNLDEHRTCSCGNDMVETERDEDGRVIVPERVTDGSVTRTVARVPDATA